MSDSEFQRARQPHQKAHRRAEILQIAQQMLDEDGLDRLSLNELARRIGLAKSNLYRYFESRESILLHVLHQEIRDWVDGLIAKLQRLQPSARIDRLAGLLATHTAARPRFCLLNSVLGTILERNVSAETARDLKLANLQQLQRLVGAMTRAVPELTVAQHGELIGQFLALVTGHWTSADPAEPMRQALSDPQLQSVRHDVEAALERGALLLARGLLAEPP